MVMSAVLDSGHVPYIPDGVFPQRRMSEAKN